MKDDSVRILPATSLSKAFFYPLLGPIKRDLTRRSIPVTWMNRTGIHHLPCGSSMKTSTRCHSKWRMKALLEVPALATAPGDRPNDPPALTHEDDGAVFASFGATRGMGVDSGGVLPTSGVLGCTIWLMASVYRYDAPEVLGPGTDGHLRRDNVWRVCRTVASPLEVVTGWEGWRTPKEESTNAERICAGLRGLDWLGL